jgi:hypothetical protein
MNEFRLQKALTSIWAAQGLTVGGERLYLAAWEVMTDWRINDAARHWNRPSVDFVCLDSAGRLVLIELKRTVSTPRQAWSVLCQVNRAVELARSYTPLALDDAHRACRSGRHGRVAEHAVEPVVSAHARFFGLEVRSQLSGRPVRRAVAATMFGRAWPVVLDSFTTSRPEKVADELRRRYRTEAKGSREMARFLGLDVAQPNVMGPVVPLLVDESWVLAIDRPEESGQPV